MIYIILFILGVCFWSFWSVITYRLGNFSLVDMWEWKKEFRDAVKSILIWRSKCPSCKHILHARDLVPLVSYISNWGKCHYCKQDIGVIYPLLEIGCGLLFMLVGYYTLQTDMSELQIILWICVSRLLYLLMAYDIQTKFLHEIIWIKTSIITICLLALSKWLLRYYAIQRGVLFLVFFLGIYYFAKAYVWRRWKKHAEWFWIGDVRLAPVIGCLFGLMQVWYTDSPIFFEWIKLFQRYIIIVWVLWLAYAWVAKIFFPKTSVREIPFFPCMIIWLWIIMIIIGSMSLQ